MKIISLCRIRVVCAVRVILPEKRSGISARNNREIGADCKGIVALYSIGFSGRLVLFSFFLETGNVTGKNKASSVFRSQNGFRKEWWFYGK